MKILTAIAAAGLFVSTATIATSANAQTYNGHGQYDRDHHGDRNRHDDRGRHSGWNNGRHNGWNNHRHCWTEWRHHHRVRICR